MSVSGTRFPPTPFGIDAKMMQRHPKNGFRSRVVSIKLSPSKQKTDDQPKLIARLSYRINN